MRPRGFSVDNILMTLSRRDRLVGLRLCHELILSYNSRVSGTRAAFIAAKALAREISSDGARWQGRLGNEGAKRRKNE